MNDQGPWQHGPNARQMIGGRIMFAPALLLCESVFIGFGFCAVYSHDLMAVGRIGHYPIFVGTFIMH